MFCSKCLTAIPDNATFCPNCGSRIDVRTVPPQQQYDDAPPPAYPEPVQVTNWLIPGILATLCCCMPLGIVTIVFACMANSHAEHGQYEEAQKAANLAQIFFWVSLGLGLVVNLLYVISTLAES